MSKYFSPSAAGFFDEAIHGPRQLQEVDQPHQDWAIADAGEDQEKIEQLLANPRFKLVDNPDCKIPADAVLISDERHAELMQELNEGKMPVLDGDQVVAVDRQRDLEEQLADIRSRRDQMLRASDWTQMPDALTAAKRKAWADHRKILRDLPDMVAKAVKAGQAPESVPFPEPPAAKGGKAK